MSYIGSKRSSSLVSFNEGTIGSGVTFPTFVGMIASFATSSFTDEFGVVTGAPTGWIVCNGAQYAIADYGDLYTAIGTTWGALTDVNGGAGSTHFRVPDLRGAFLRGTGSHGSSTMANSSAFAGASVGSFENDSFQSHYHSAHFTNAFGNTQVPGYLAVLNNHNQYYTTGGASTMPTGTIKLPTDDGTNGTPRTGAETKPFNAGINYCIKY